MTRKVSATELGYNEVRQSWECSCLVQQIQGNHLLHTPAIQALDSKLAKLEQTRQIRDFLRSYINSLLFRSVSFIAKSDLLWDQTSHPCFITRVDRLGVCLGILKKK